MKTKHILTCLFLALCWLTAQADEVFYNYRFQIEPKETGFRFYYDSDTLVNNVPAGSSLHLPNISGYSYHDYEFEAWFNSAGDTISTDRWNGRIESLPAHDETYTAKFIYNPANPALPGDSLDYFHKQLLTLKTEPRDQVSQFTVGVESLSSFYAQENEPFQAIVGKDYTLWPQYRTSNSHTLSLKDDQGNIISPNDRGEYHYVMPDRDVTLTFFVEYNPNSPSLPDTNPYDEALGLLIMDDFAPDYLWNRAYDVLSRNQNNYINTVIVNAPITEYDLCDPNHRSYTSYGLGSLTELDFSRTTGATRMYNWAISSSKLERLKLPASIDSLDYCAIRLVDIKYGNMESNFKELTIFAKTPPRISTEIQRYSDGSIYYDYRSLQLPEGTIIRVPATSLKLYREAEGWNEYTILPIVDDVVNVTVNFPAGTDMQLYRDMQLEVRNTKSGDRYSYVVNNRTSYIFSEVIKKASYEVILRNAQGQIFGRSEVFNIEEDDMQITLSSLSVPLTAEVSVLTPDNVDVTDQVSIQWLDAEGKYLSSGNLRASQISGTELMAHITLSEALAVMYQQPADLQWTLSTENFRQQVSLTPLPQTQWRGTITGDRNQLPLEGVTVTATQRLNGVMTSTSTSSNNRGEFSLQLKQADAIVTYSASGYSVRTDTLTAATIAESVAASASIVMEELTGSVITLSLKRAEAVTEGENLVYAELFDLPKNALLELKDAYSGKTYSGFEVQFPEVVMRERLDDGTQLKVTLKSTDNMFETLSEYVTVNDNKAATSFSIVAPGALHAKYSVARNSQVVGMLYNGEGNLVASGRFDSKRSLSFDNLQSGLYTLVTMGECKFLNSFLSLSQIGAAGLSEGTDYATVSAYVNNGFITQATVDKVPLIAENKFYYTGEGTSVTLNKASIVTGNILTLSTKFDFKPEHADKVSNVCAIFDLPASTEFVQNSLLLGNTPIPYTLDGQKVIVPLDGNQAERLRFCFTPTDEGLCRPTAYLQFEIDGQEILQPIGNPICEVKNLEISMSSNLIEPRFTVVGMGPVGSQVRVLVDNAEMARSQVKSNGEWSAQVELIEPYNLQDFTVHAELTTPNGMELKSQSMIAVYDSNYVEPVSVHMNFYNAYYHKDFDIYFNLKNKTISQNYYYFYKETDFTFFVEMSRPDPELIESAELLVYTSNRKWNSVDLAYNDSVGMWVGTSKFNSSALPEGVEVRVVNNSGRILGSAVNDQAFDNLFSFGEGRVSSEELEALTAQLESMMSDDASLADLQALNDQMAAALGITFDRSDWDNETFTVDDLRATCDEIDALLSSFSSDYSAMENLLLNQGGDLIEGMHFESCNGVTEEELIEQGFTVTPMSDGKTMYTLTTPSEYHIMMPDKDLHIIFDSGSSMMRVIRIQQTMMQTNNFIDDIAEYKDAIQGLMEDYYGVLKDVGSAVAEMLDQLRANNAASIKKLGDVTKQLEFAKQSHWNFVEVNWVKFRIEALNKAIDANCKAIDWIEKNLGGLVTTGGKFAKIGLGIFDLASNCMKWNEDLDKLVSIYGSIPDPCPRLQSYADNLRSMIVAAGVAAIAFYTYNISSTIGSLFGISGGVVGAAFSGGVSLAAVGLAIGAIAANYALGKGYSYTIEKVTNHVTGRVRDLRCTGNEPPCPKCHKLYCICNAPRPSIPGKLDPSGYVYEGVESNRMEGVTAICYFKETVEDMYGDLYEHEDIWDGEPFGEINPQLTDKMGMYHWDVPQGLWQVRLQKDGYEETRSEWLPVPPPQLEVNLAMKQNTPPTVLSAHVYTSGAEVQFSKFMNIETLADNILLRQEGEEIEATILPLDEEMMGGDTLMLASRVRIVPAVAFESGKEVQLMVSRQVKSYAGIRMEQDFEQSFDIEPEVSAIVAEPQMMVHEGETLPLQVKVEPAEAAQGKKLLVEVAGSILSVDAQELNLDQHGAATLQVHGLIPGTTAIRFTVEGLETISAQTLVSISRYSAEPPLAPVASIESGSVVEIGTGIYLSCHTPNASIYYTLDGTCPCDEAARFRYDGTPIIITGDTHIRALAVSQDGIESEETEFYYMLTGTGIETLQRSSVSVFPTIAHDFINVILPEEVTESEVLLVGMDGKCYLTGKANDGRLVLHVGHLPAGSYIVLSKSGIGIEAGRIIKQ